MTAARNEKPLTIEWEVELGEQIERPVCALRVTASWRSTCGTHDHWCCTFGLWRYQPKDYAECLRMFDDMLIEGDILLGYIQYAQSQDVEPCGYREHPKEATQIDGNLHSLDAARRNKNQTTLH